MSGIIYGLIDERNNSLFYIGSTTLSLSDRFSRHINASKVKDTPVYQTINEIGIENIGIISIEIYDDISVEELRKREGEYIKENIGMGITNIVIAGRTRAEHYQDTKEHQSHIHKKYYIKNRDRLISYAKEYHEANRDEILRKKREKAATEEERAKRREYLEKNKEHIRKLTHENYLRKKAEKLEYQRRYRAANREKVNAKQREYRASKRQNDC